MPSDLFTLKVTDPAGTGGPTSDGVYQFRIANGDEAGQDLRISTVSTEGATAPRPFSINLLPLDGGLGPGWLGGNPRSYIDGLIDTSWLDGVYPGTEVNTSTLTSAVAQGTHAVQWDGALFVLSGRYVHKISSAYSVSTDRDLNTGQASAVGVSMAVVGGELVVCTSTAAATAGFIQKSTAAGVWSTSTDVRAWAVRVVKDLVWRIGSSASAIVDNSFTSQTALGSSVATDIMTAANWTDAGYKVGDDSYQAYEIVDYGGVPWVRRRDGLYQPDPETKFSNQTPQLALAPDANDYYGLWTGWGYIWVPTDRGLLRVQGGESIRVGIETAMVPGANFITYSGVEWDRRQYLVVRDLKNLYTYVMKMERDTSSAATGAYIFTPIYRKSYSSTHYGRYIAAFVLPTNPTLYFGGGTAATTANRILLGRGSGRDIDDSNYIFGQASFVRTGPIMPDPSGAFTAVFHGIEMILNGIASGVNVTALYSVDSASAPATNFKTSQETTPAGSNNAPTANGSNVMYCATGAKGSFIDVRLNIIGNDLSSRSILRQARIFGMLVPNASDEIKVRVICSDETEIVPGQLSGYSGTDGIEKLRYWRAQGTVLLAVLPGYEEDRNTRVLIKDVDAVVQYVKSGPHGRPVQEFAAIVTMQRLDYASVYAN